MNTHIHTHTLCSGSTYINLEYILTLSQCTFIHSLYWKVKETVGVCARMCVCVCVCVCVCTHVRVSLSGTQPLPVCLCAERGDRVILHLWKTHTMSSHTLTVWNPPCMSRHTPAKVYTHARTHAHAHMKVHERANTHWYPALALSQTLCSPNKEQKPLANTPLMDKVLWTSAANSRLIPSQTKQ